MIIPARSWILIFSILAASSFAGCLDFDFFSKSEAPSEGPCLDGDLLNLTTAIGDWVLCAPLDFDRNITDDFVDYVDDLNTDGTRWLSGTTAPSLEQVLAGWRTYQTERHSTTGNLQLSLQKIDELETANVTVINGTWGQIGTRLSALADQPESEFKSAANRQLAPLYESQRDAKAAVAVTALIGLAGGVIAGAAAAAVLFSKSSKKAAYWRAFGKSADIETRLHQLAVVALGVCMAGAVSLLALAIFLEVPFA